ncbi:hypothetical protein Efla_004442 [Eimeria flavescens]
MSRTWVATPRSSSCMHFSVSEFTQEGLQPVPQCTVGDRGVLKELQIAAEKLFSRRLSDSGGGRQPEADNLSAPAPDMSFDVSNLSHSRGSLQVTLGISNSLMEHTDLQQPTQSQLALTPVHRRPLCTTYELCMRTMREGNLDMSMAAVPAVKTPRDSHQRFKTPSVDDKEFLRMGEQHIGVANEQNVGGSTTQLFLHAFSCERIYPRGFAARGVQPDSISICAHSHPLKTTARQGDGNPSDCTFAISLEESVT